MLQYIRIKEMLSMFSNRDKHTNVHLHLDWFNLAEIKCMRAFK